MYVIYDMFVYVCLYPYMYIYHHISIEYDIHPWYHPTTSTQLYNTPRYDHPPPHRPPPGSFGESKASVFGVKNRRLEEDVPNLNLMIF